MSDTPKKPSELSERIATRLSPRSIRITAKILDMVDGQTGVTEMSNRLVEEGVYSTVGAATSAVSPLLRDLSWLLKSETGQPVIIPGEHKRIPYSINPEAADIYEDIKLGLGMIALELESKDGPQRKSEKASRRSQQKPRKKMTLEEERSDYFKNVLAVQASTLLQKKDKFLGQPEELLRANSRMRMVEALAQTTTQGCSELLIDELSVRPADIRELESLTNHWFENKLIRKQGAINSRERRTVLDASSLAIIADTLEERVVLAKEPHIDATEEAAFLQASSTVNNFLGGKLRMVFIGNWSIKQAALVRVSLENLPARITNIAAVASRVNQLQALIDDYLAFWGYSRPESKDIESTTEAEILSGDRDSIVATLLDISGDRIGVGYNFFLKKGYLDFTDLEARAKARKLYKELPLVADEINQLVGRRVVRVIDSTNIIVGKLTDAEIEKINSSF